MVNASLIVGWLVVCIASIDALADDAAPCQVHVILFVPSGVNPPAGYQQRIDQVVDYTESFFQREFKRWGHEDIVMPFRRSASGHVDVLTIQGKEKASQYKPVAVRGEVMDSAEAALRHAAEHQQNFQARGFAQEALHGLKTELDRKPKP